MPHRVDLGHVVADGLGVVLDFSTAQITDVGPAQHAGLESSAAALGALGGKVRRLGQGLKFKASEIFCL